MTNLQWVISGYMLANGATLIVGGHVGDILGRRRWLAIGMVAFGLSSLAGGLAPNSSVLGAIAMGLVGGLVPFILVAVFAGLGFGMSWAFASVSTQAVVRAANAGQASGVVLTIVVTMGGVAIALASTVVESASAGNSGLETALQGVLVGAGALAVLMSAVLVLLGRRSHAPAPAAAARRRDVQSKASITVASSARLARLCPDTSRSMCGNAARMPRVAGS